MGMKLIGLQHAGHHELVLEFQSKASSSDNEVLYAENLWQRLYCYCITPIAYFLLLQDFEWLVLACITAIYEELNRSYSNHCTF